MSSPERKISCLLVVADPVEVSPGVYQTLITHPKLEGALHFVHSHSGGREEFLKALDENIVGHFQGALTTLGELIDGLGRSPAKPSVKPSEPAKD